MTDIADLAGWVTWHCTACGHDWTDDPILPGPCPSCAGNG